MRKGTVISFTRDWQGNIKARANDHDLVTVTSPKLAQAVFDIYLGDQVQVLPFRAAGRAFQMTVVASYPGSNLDAKIMPPDGSTVSVRDWARSYGSSNEASFFDRRSC